jgi:hypothetical protein
MAATTAQKGIGVVWGVGNLTCTGVIDSTHGRLQNFDFERSSDRIVIKDENGEMAGQIFNDLRKKLTVTIIPSGSTIANAATNASALQPVPGTTFAILNSTESIMAGTYSLISAKRAASNEKENAITCELEMSEANDATTAKT